MGVRDTVDLSDDAGLYFSIKIESITYLDKPRRYFSKLSPEGTIVQVHIFAPCRINQKEDDHGDQPTKAKRAAGNS
jgi:hypothetical protein